MGLHDITPHKSLFGKLGARSRALPMVCTELVDNSLDSWISMPEKFKKNKKLTVEIEPSESKTRTAWFTIKDNAGGMTEAQLANALKIAHSEKTNKSGMIGAYGFGLKSACMYIGSKFRIYTCSYTDPETIWFMEFDRNKFEETKDDKDVWKIQITKLSKQDAAKHEVFFPNKHGTEIRILNERYKSANKDGITRRLSRIFGPRLQKPRGASGMILPPEDQMILKFKKEQLLADGPFYTPYQAPGKDDLAKLKKEEGTLKISEKLKGAQKEAAVIPNASFTGYKLINIPRTKIADGRFVKGIVGILDRSMAHNNHYGFDLIKNGRVIETHVLDRDSKSKRIGLVASNHNARIVGQLFLDDLAWKTDHQKTEFIKDDDHWEKLAEVIHKHISPLYKVSSHLQYPNQDKAKTDPKTSLATKVFENALPSINKSAQKASKSAVVRETLEGFTAANTAEIIKEASKTKPKSVSAITSVKFHIDYSHSGKESPLVSKKESTSKGQTVYTIKLNLDHPFLSTRESAELKVIGEFLSIDAQSEYFLKARSGILFDDFAEIREKILTDFKS